MSMYPSPPETASSAVRGPRAGFWRRFAAALIDGILVGIVGLIIELVLGRGLGGVVAFVLGVAYYGWLEGSNSGQTIGKRTMGIRVYDFRRGGPIGTGRAVGRYFARWLSAIPCFLGYLWMLWDGEKQTWHDKLIGDVVVPVTAYPVDSWPN